MAEPMAEHFAHRSRSRSRTARSRSRTPAPVSIPREPIIHISATLRFNDGFAGMGIPKVALFRTLARLWNQEICVKVTSMWTYEVDPDANRASNAIVPNIYGISKHGPFNVSEFPEHCLQPRGPVTMISIAEMVPPAVKLWKHTIAAAMGQDINMRTLQHHAARDRNFYIVPTVPQPVIPPKGSMTPYVHTFDDGSTWPWQGTATTSPPTLRAIYPELLRRADREDISPADRSTIHKFRIRTLEGSSKFAGVRQWTQWLGLNTRQYELLSREFPCSSVNCGCLVLREQRAALCTILGRAWNLHEAEQVLYLVLEQVLSNVRNGPKTIDLYTSGAPCAKISRGIACSHPSDHIEAGPHAAPSNLMWTWHRGLVTVARDQHSRFRSVNFFTPQNLHFCQQENCPDVVSSAQAFAMKD